MGDKGKNAPPFIKVPTVIQDSTQLDAGHRAVYLAIKAHENAKTGQCNPSNETIAKAAGLSLATVKRHKADLVKKGILNIQRGYQSSVQYSFPLDKITGHSLRLMRDLKRKQGKSLLGDWIEKTEDSLSSPVTLINRKSIRLKNSISLGSPVTHKQEERTTHGRAAPFRGGGGGGRGGDSQETKKNPIEEKGRNFSEDVKEIETEAERRRHEREAKAEANRAEHERILAEYRARKGKEKEA